MYSLKLPEDFLERLYILREYCAEGPIARQVKKAITDYLASKEKEIGCPIQDVKETLDRHYAEKIRE